MVDVAEAMETNDGAFKPPNLGDVHHRPAYTMISEGIKRCRHNSFRHSEMKSTEK
jgi:hypothetical protein